MKRNTMIMLGALSALAIAGPASAQTSSAEAQSKASGAVDQKHATVSQQASSEARLQAVRDRAAQASAEAAQKVDTKLAAEARKVDVESDQKGEAAVAARLGKEFHMSADALIDERARLGAGWGELMIAHTLDAGSNAGVTVNQLFDLRQDGMGWGRIAAGLGLSAGKVMSAVQAETRVARGLDRPDGRVGSLSATASTSSSTQANVGSTGVGLNTGLGIGLGKR